MMNLRILYNNYNKKLKIIIIDAFVAYYLFRMVELVAELMYL